MIEFTHSDQLIISSSANNIVEVERLLEKLRNSLKIKEEKYYNILVAVTEAANNAIVHGNKSDAAKKVRISVRANSEVLEIEINDQGGGFNPESIADPREPENLLKDHGRGIFLMRSLSDSLFIESNQDGSKITMIFNYIQ